MQKFLFFISLFLALSLQTVTTVPFVLVVLLAAYIFYKESWIFFAAFLSGILQDVISVRVLGESSIFFILFLLLVDLYGKKFEVQTLSFAALASLFGSLGFLLVFGYSAILQQAIMTTFLSILFFLLITWIGKRKNKAEFA